MLLELLDKVLKAQIQLLARRTHLVAMPDTIREPCDPHPALLPFNNRCGPVGFGIAERYDVYSLPIGATLNTPEIQRRGTGFSPRLFSGTFVVQKST